MDELEGGAVEDDAILVEDEKFGAVVDAVVGDSLDLSGSGVDVVHRESEGVLEAVGDEQRGGVGDVALLDDEVDDGGGGDGVEAAGGGVVEDEVGLGDDGAGDGDAAAHAAGELGRELVDGLGELDELEDLSDAVADIFFGDVGLKKTVTDVVFDREGVEEGRLLEDHADAGAELVEIVFGHGGDILTEDADGAGVGLEEAVGELHEYGFATACWAKNDAGFGRLDSEGDVAEDYLFVEGEGDVLEGDDGLAGGRKNCGGLGQGLGHGVFGEKLAAEDADHESGDEEVDDDDEDRGDDDGLGGGFADALGATGGVETEVTSYGGDDEAGEERFGQALDYVPADQATVGAVQVGVGVEADDGDGDEGAASDAAGVGEDGEEEEHEDGGDEARGDELADGVGAEGSHGVYLLGDLHGAELGGDAGGVAAGDHEAGEDGAELLDHGEGDEGAGFGLGAEGVEGGGGLERKDAAGEETGEDDDGHGAYADGIHLGIDLVPINGARKKIRDGAPDEDGVLLDGSDLLFDVEIWRDEGHCVMWLNLSDAGCELTT